MDKTLENLMSIKTNAQVLALLNTLSIASSTQMPNSEKYVWRLVGKDLSNASHVQLAKSSVTPIVERIINGYDAHIELKEIEELKGNSDRSLLPASPRSAVAKWYKIPNGDLATYAYNLENKQRDKFADEFVKLTFEDSGDRMLPTLTIRDRGIGQHPSAFPDTLLQLGNSNKMGDPCQHGNYGHGGAATYRYCTYSIIISRRAQTALNGKKDEIGWTIIRKNQELNVWDDIKNKVEYVKAPPVYQYLSLREGGVPTVEPDDQFPYGTYIAHIEYNAKHWQNISFEAWRALRTYLFDPVLPYKLIDNRPQQNSKVERSRSMFGACSALIKSKDVAYDNEVEEHLEDGGVLKIKYWVLYDENDKERRPLKNYLERDNSKDTIVLTLNGQRHSSLDKSIIAHELRMPRLSDYLLVQIVTDGMTREAKGGLFTADRESLSASEEIDLIKKKLTDALADDDLLREWEKKLGKISVENNESQKEVEKLLDQLLEIGLTAEFGEGNKAKMQGVGSKTPYIPQDPPIVFDFLTKKELEVTQGTSKTLTLALNGTGNLFTRRNNKGYVQVIAPKGIHAYVKTSEFADGRLPIVIEAESNAQIDTSYKLKLTFKSANLKTPLEFEKRLVVIPAQVFVPIEPPTKLNILRKDPIRVYPEDKKIIPISFDGMDDILTRPIGTAKLDIFCNYSEAAFIRRRGPKNGRIQLTMQVNDVAKIGDSFKIGCRLTLSGGDVLQDNKTCVVEARPIITPQERNKGALIEASKPNYKFIPVWKESWSTYTWTEEDSSKFDVDKDDDGRDRLLLIVNMDNKELEAERQRRTKDGTSPSSLTLLNSKYAAYVCYHLYQQYNSQNPSKEKQEQEDTDVSGMKVFDDEQLNTEMKRVTKTLLYTLSRIKSVEIE